MVSLYNLYMKPKLVFFEILLSKIWEIDRFRKTVKCEMLLL